MSCGGNDLSVKAGALSGVPRRGRRGDSARRAGRAEGDYALGDTTLVPIFSWEPGASRKP